MKVFFTFTPAFNPENGGVQKTTYKLGRYFTEKGCHVVYYSLAKEGHIEPSDGVLYHSSEEGKEDNPNNIKRLETVLNKEQPEYVINQMPYENPLRKCLKANKEKIGYWLLGCLRNSLFSVKSNLRTKLYWSLPGWAFKLIDHPPGLQLVQLRHWLKHRSYLKAILNDHDRFVLLTLANHEELNHFVGNYKKEKVTTIPNSIPGVNPETLDKKEKIILYVGRLKVKQKRVDLLADFWEKVYAYLPEWHFKIVGDGPYRSQLEEDINTKNLDRIQLEGYQDPTPYFERASIFVMFSGFEGFPNVLLEAQSYGVVPFAFNSYAALAHIVNHNRDAMLSKPFDTSDMANQILSVGQDPKQLEDMRYAAIQNAERFTINIVGQEWLKLFHQLTGGKDLVNKNETNQTATSNKQ